ncbi:MAG: type IV pilus assembly protein PilM [Candidatus Staskawiczbacteria bacterium]|nr:type IV pilus assembly protein PilM [Candidatus Staskawiczbacteria bacterium]
MALELPANFNIEKIKKLNIFENPLKMFFPKKMVGIDVGTASIKIVEISRWGQGKTLENYGEIKSVSLFKEPFRNVEKGSYMLSNYFVSRAIRAVLDEARIRTKGAIFSIPDFSTFCTSFDLPPMTAKELNDAVYYNAPQYIPLPVTETTLDWKLISGIPGDKKSPLRIFLVAIPNQIIQDYQKVAQLAGLELYAVEAEALGLARSLVREKKGCICVIDIGAQSTTINVVDKLNLKKSFSFDFSGNQLTYSISSALGLGHVEAEELKNREGLISAKEEISKTLYLLVDPLILETKRVLSDFYQQENKDVDLVYLTGGTAALPGLKEYFQEILKKNVEIPNCFSELLYPPILGRTLENMAPSFSVATGVALGGLEI